MCIPAVMFGSAWWSLFGSGTPGLDLAFVEVVGWSMLAALPLAGLIGPLELRSLDEVRTGR
jgi:hypothetical protein